MLDERHEKDQPRDENFDKATSSRRTLVERLIGWFKERRLGSRYEKFGSHYVALWLLAIIEIPLFRLLPNRA